MINSEMHLEDQANELKEHLKNNNLDDAYSTNQSNKQPAPKQQVWREYRNTYHRNFDKSNDPKGVEAETDSAISHEDLDAYFGRSEEHAYTFYALAKKFGLAGTLMPKRIVDIWV